MRTYRDKYNEARSRRLNWMRQAQEDVKFYLGEHWTPEQRSQLESQGHAPIAFNLVYRSVELAAALMTTENPRYQVTAREISDQELAKAMGDVLEWIWRHSEAHYEVKQMVRDYLTTGAGHFIAYPEADGMIKNVVLDPMTVFPDPASRHPLYDDASYIVIARTFSESQLRLQYPDWDLTKAMKETEDTGYGMTDYTEIGPVVDSMLEDSYLLLDFYEKSMHYKYRFSHATGTWERETVDPREMLQEQFLKLNGQLNMEPDQQQQYRQMYEQLGQAFLMGEEGPVPLPENPEEIQMAVEAGYQIMQFEVVGLMDLIQSQEVKFDKVSRAVIVRTLLVGDTPMQRMVYDCPHYPIVPTLNSHVRNPYPTSDVRQVRDLQKFINKMLQLIVAHTASSTNLKLLMPRGLIDRNEIEQEWGRPGVAVIEFDPAAAHPPMSVGPVPLSGEVYNNINMARSAIEDVLGVYSHQQGDVSGGPTTYRGTILMDEFGNRRIKSKMDDVERCLSRLGLVNLHLVRQFWDEHKLRIVLDPNRSPFTSPLRKPVSDRVVGDMLRVEATKYDVYVLAGSTLPVNRWARFEYYMQMFQMGLLDDVALMQEMDFPNAEELLERKGFLQTAMQQLDQASEAVEELMTENKKVNEENLDLLKKIEVLKFKSDLEEIALKGEVSVSQLEQQLEQLINQRKSTS